MIALIFFTLIPNSFLCYQPSTFYGFSLQADSVPARHTEALGPTTPEHGLCCFAKKNSKVAGGFGAEFGIDVYTGSGQNQGKSHTPTQF
jgi:hypothetical protein